MEGNTRDLEQKKESYVTAFGEAINFSSSPANLIYKAISSMQDQRGYYEFPEPPAGALREDQRAFYESFGIVFGKSKLALDNSKRNYLIIVQPEWYSNLEEMCEDYCLNVAHIPEDKAPTHYIIDKQIDTLEEARFWMAAMKSIYPDIVPLEDYTWMKEEETNLMGKKSLVEEVTSLGYTPFFLDDLLDPIVEEYQTNNSRTLQLIREAEAKILEASKHSKIILMAGDSHPLRAASFAAYMYAQHRIPSHFSLYSEREYRSTLSTLLFNRNSLLVEDQINYIKQLPRVMITNSSDTNLSYFVFLEKSKMSCDVRVTYMDIESSQSNLEFKTISIWDLFIIPWKDEFDIQTKEISIFKEEHDRIMDLFRKFEERQRPGAPMLTMTNTALMMINGRKVLALVEGFDLRLPALFIPLDNSLSKFRGTITLDNLHRFFPIDIYADYQRVLAPYIKSIAETLKAEGSSPTGLASFHRHNYYFGHFIYQYNNDRKELNLSSVNDFIMIGLWWKETLVYKLNLSKVLEKHMDTKRMRHFNDFFSIFGGPVPFLSRSLELREEYLKE